MQKDWFGLIVDIMSLISIGLVAIFFVGLLILWCTRGFSGLAEFYRYVKGKDK